MILIHGQRMCGRVDDVPGICYIATRFFHFYYIPLIPLSSWLIEAKPEVASGFQGRRIKLSAKSVVVGWLQAFLLLFGLVNSAKGGFGLMANQQAGLGTDGAIKMVLGLTALIMWTLLMVRPFQAGKERSEQLRGLLGFEPDVPNQQAASRIAIGE